MISLFFLSAFHSEGKIKMALTWLELIEPDEWTQSYADSDIVPANFQEKNEFIGQAYFLNCSSDCSLVRLH